MDMWQMMQDEGGSRMGTHGLLTVLERMNNMRVSQYNEDGSITTDPSSDEAQEMELRTPRKNVNLGSRPAM